MSDDFEKTATNILGDEQGSIPTSIKQLAIGLDSYFEKKSIQETERHNQIMAAIKADKEKITETCKICKNDVDAKFQKIKYVMFFSENPKLAGVLAVALIIIIVSGLQSIITGVDNIVSQMIKTVVK